MWIFLVTEVLFFGGMFLTYTINRHEYFTAFGIGSNTLDITLGTVNTIVLIMSSFTMAMAVWSAETGKKKLVPLFLILTLGLGCVFLGIKFVEYKQKFEHHLIPGRNFAITYRSSHPAPGDDPKEIALEKEEVEKAFASDPDANSHAQLLFALFRHDRASRPAHDRGRRPDRLADQGFAPRPLHAAVQHAGRDRRLVLALRRYCVDLSFPVAISD